MKTRNKIKRALVPIMLCLVLALTLWAPAQAASAADYQKALKLTLNNILDTVTNPASNSTEGEWAVLALARGGVENDAWYGKYMDSVIAKVIECNGVLSSKQYTEYSRVIIGLSAIRQDASALNTGSKVYDLVSPLMNKQDNGEYWASWQGNNGTIFAIIALDTQNYLNNNAGNTTRKGLLDTLLTAQLSSGAWEISKGSGADIDTTAMALQALAPYYLSQSKYTALGAAHTYAQLQSSVTNALNYLNTRKNGDYGSVEAAAQVVVALAALNRDAASDALLGDALGSVLSYYNGSGGFVHDHNGSSANQQMSTEQGAYALVAYERWKNGKTSLYNMTDRPAASSISFSGPTAATVTQTASGKFTVTCQKPCVVVIEKADGTYACLTPEGSGDTRTFHTVHGSVTVLIRGDATGDGRFNLSDVIFAKAVFMKKTSMDSLHLMAADTNKDLKFNLSDVIRAKAAFLGKTDLNW